MQVFAARCRATAAPALCTYNGSFTDGLVFVTIPVRQADTHVAHLIARYTNAANYLDLEVFRDDGGWDTVTLYEISGASSTIAGPFNILYGNGDSFGLKLLNTVAEVWYKPFGGAWILLGSGVCIVQCGYIGLLAPDITIRFDDFGGCELTSWTGAPTAPGCSFKNGYRIITPDGETFDFASPGFCMAIGIPDGFGLPPITHNTKTIYGMPGAYLEAIDVQPRVVTITATMHARDRATLHALRHKLFGALRWNRTLVSPPEPAQMLYEVDGVVVRLYVHYLSDVISNVNANDDRAQLVGVRLVAYDPVWYAVTQTTRPLNIVSNVTMRLIVSKVGGVWDVLGPPDPAGGFYISVTGITENSTYLYIAGSFENFDNIASNDYVAQYNKTTKVWSAMSAVGADNTILTMTKGPDGRIYVAGDFHSIGGILANHIAVYDPVTMAWAALGSGTDNRICKMAFNNGGTILYIAGDFTNAGGIAALGAASWTTATSTWAALGVSLDNAARTVAVSKANLVFYGGAFHNAGGVAADHIASWNPATGTWAAVGSGTDSDVRDIVFNMAGNLCAVGWFTTAGGISANRAAMWNGSAWSALSTGLDNEAEKCFSLSDGTLIISGSFSNAGGIPAVAMARWNGTAWSAFDIDMPGSIVWAVMESSNGDIYYGTNYSGVASLSGVSLVPMLGTFDTSPIITITGPGTLQWIENSVTGKRMIFNCWINAGETVTIDPRAATFTSGWRGDMFPYAALLPQSDFADFTLAPDPIAPLGINTIAVYMTGTTAASSASESHYDEFLTADDAVYSND